MLVRIPVAEKHVHSVGCSWELTNGCVDVQEVQGCGMNKDIW